MEIITMKTSDVLPYLRNAKKHNETQINNVAQSIKEFGFTQPIVVDKDNNIIIGHCRTLAAQKLGIEEIPVVKMEDLTPEQANKLRLLDNKLNESEWDIGLLSEDIPTLNFEGFDINWGISDLTDLSDEFLNSLYGDKEDKSKEPKKIQCPHCGEWFEQ